MILLDANVLLRFITKQPPVQAEAARSILRRGQTGEFELRVLPLTLAEVYYVLRRVYTFESADAKHVLLSLVTSRAFELEHEAAVLVALETLGPGIDFEDAYLAARARLADGQVASFDRDFDRLGVARIDPAKLMPES